MQLIMSSNQLASIQQPVVSLDLDITEDGQKRKETIELSKEELSHLISSLEAANRVWIIIMAIAIIIGTEPHTKMWEMHCVCVSSYVLVLGSDS